jgi:hypothetical protein
VRRKLFTIVAATSALLFVAMAVLSLRAVFATDVVGVYTPYAYVEVDNYTIHLTVVATRTSSDFRLAWVSGPASRSYSPWAIWLHSNSPFIFSLGFPRWAVMLVAAILLTWWVVISRRKPVAPNACRSCGYDLRATPDRCPECGAVPAKVGAV